MPTFPPDPVPGSPVSASWMRRMLAACRASMPLAGNGARLRYTPNGTFIDVVGTAAADKTSLEPFAVRWHQPGNADGQWEIYLPAGSGSLAQTCAPINAEAADTSGHDGETDWYVIPFSGQPADGDEYTVIVHLKQRVADADNLPQNGDPEVSPAMLAWMHKTVSDPSDRTDSEQIAYAGDGESFTVATIRYVAPDGGGAPAPTVIQTRLGSVTFPGTVNQEFDLWWAFEINGSTLTVAEMGLLRRTLSTGTDVATIDDPVDVTDAAEGIYLRVELNGSAVELTVALDVNVTTAGDNFFIVQLYEVDEYHVASDFRSALWRLPMYLGGVS